MRKALRARVQVSALTLLLLVLMALVRAGQAQSFDASNIDHPTNLADTWLVKAGDDPAYAQPGFDDSGCAAGAPSAAAIAKHASCFPLS